MATAERIRPSSEEDWRDDEVIAAELTETVANDETDDEDEELRGINPFGFERVEDIEAAEAQEAEALEAAMDHEVPRSLATADKQYATTDPLKLFLREAGEYPLLTPYREVELAKQKELYANLREEVNKELKVIYGQRNVPDGKFAELIGQKIDVMPADLQDEVKASQHAFNLFINSNLRLVVSISKRYQTKGLSLLDLIQEGTLGLTRAVEKFNWRKGYKFSTYATWWISQACDRAVANHAKTIRQPVHVVERARKIERVTRSLTTELGREIDKTSKTDRQLIAEQAGLPLKQVEEVLDSGTVVDSTNRPIGYEEDSAELGDFLPPGDGKSSVSAEDLAVESAISQALLNAVSKLPGKMSKVIALRYGLVGGEPLNLSATGRELGITREAVRKLEIQALGKLAAISSNLR